MSVAVTHFISSLVSAIKVRAHSMYTDTNFNSRTTVYSNIYQAMLVVALKFQAYIQDWCGSLKGKITFFWSTFPLALVGSKSSGSKANLGIDVGVDALQKIVKYEHSALVRQGRNRKAAKLSASFDLERSQVIWYVLSPPQLLAIYSSLLFDCTCAGSATTLSTEFSLAPLRLSPLSCAFSSSKSRLLEFVHTSQLSRR